MVATAQVQLPGGSPSPHNGQGFAFVPKPGRRSHSRSHSHTSSTTTVVSDKGGSSGEEQSLARDSKRRTGARSGSLLSTASAASSVAGDPRRQHGQPNRRHSAAVSAAGSGHGSYTVQRGKVATPPTDVLRVHGNMHGMAPAKGRGRRRETAVSMVLEKESMRIARQVWLGKDGMGIDLPPGLDVDTDDDDSEADDQAPARSPKHTPQQRIAKQLRHVTPRTPVDDVYVTRCSYRTRSACASGSV